jgi:hypothetical protein
MSQQQKDRTRKLPAEPDFDVPKWMLQEIRDLISAIENKGYGSGPGYEMQIHAFSRWLDPDKAAWIKHYYVDRGWITDD